MALKDDIQTLKNKEGTLTNNKVCNFSYDNTAFADDTTTGANGVSVYNYNNHNNIPVKDPEILKVNPTIISKGFRSQVSTLPRMLLNHIFGRVSYNLNKTVDTLNSLLTNLYNYIGQPNGLATLDNTGRLPYSQLPLSAVEYKGTWNANTNTPALASGTGTFGDEYIVSVQGTQNIGEGSITYRVGDRVIYNGLIWQRIPASSVRTVNSKTPDANGNVTVNASDMVTPDVYGYDRTNIGKEWIKASGINPNINFRVTKAFKEVFLGAVYGSGLYYSQNGKDWTSVPALSSINVTDISCSSDLCVIVGDNSSTDSVVTYWSTDGINWTQGTIDTGSASTFSQSSSVLFANNFWVLAGNTGLCWSEDGKNWTLVYNLTRYNALAYGNGIWIAGRDAYGVDYSTDGKTWSHASWSNSSQFTQNNSVYTHSAYYGNGIFVVGGRNGLFAWSSDGTSWTPCTKGGSSFTNTTTCVYFNNNLWVGVNDSNVYWSTDGKTWTQGTMTDGTSPSFNNVMFCSGIWLGGGSYIFYSNDGKNWRRVGNYSGGYFFPNFAYDNGIIVAGGSVIYSIGTLTNNVAQILDWLLFAVDNMID